MVYQMIPECGSTQDLTGDSFLPSLVTISIKGLKRGPVGEISCRSQNSKHPVRKGTVRLFQK